MNSGTYSETKLIKKIRNLPPDKITEVEDFVDFLLAKSDRILLSRAAAKLSETAFAKIWDNDEDADYDQLYNSEAGFLSDISLSRRIFV
ncbi:MAG: DUF2281 domain-containing protein [Oscillatoria sp. SIO1A7]|nr:DUF2281 domain-containing protein [Oscillatoria sp. SIO1A7]